MEQEKSLSTPLQRITVVDALRGFALLGVFIAHILQRFGLSSGQRQQLFPAWDEAIRQFSSNVISGKFIIIFAFLFGLSFFIQMDRATQKGIDFRKRFLWRMVILFVIGIFGSCFYVNDVIPLYAMFGIVLVLLYRVNNWVLVALIFLLTAGAPRIIMTGYEHIVQTEQVENVQQPTRGNQRSAAGSSGQNIEKTTFMIDVKNKLTTGMQVKMNRELGFSGRGYPTMALFIFGFMVGRLRFFENVHIRKRKNIILFAGFVLAVILLNQLITILPTPSGGRGAANATPLSLTISALNDFTRVMYAGALVMGFIILYHTKIIGKCLNILTPYGRMGLSNYEMQNVLGCFIFSSWALGPIFGSWGTTEVFALGLLIYVLQIVVSKYWMKYFLYGPFEWFWRSATYLKLQPFRR